MASGYTYELRLKDMMSSGFAKAAQASNKFYDKLIGNQNKFINQTKRVPANIAQLEKQLSRLATNRDNAFGTRKISKFNREIRKTERSLNKLKSLPPLSMGERFRKIKSSMGGMLGLVGGLAVGMAAFGAVGGIVKLGMDLEQTRVSFGVMLGSAEKGNGLLKEIDKFANVTPFANSDLQESSKMLLNFGIEGKKIVPTLKMIGDVSGGNKEKLRGLTLAFSQVSSAGKLQGQDLLQMINAGFNPLKEIARTTGESMVSLKGKMAKGALSFGMVENAFKTVTSEGGMFNGMMEKQAQTLGGRWSTLIGTFQSKMANIGEGMMPALGAIVDFSNSFVKQIQPIFDAFSYLGQAFNPLFTAIGSFVGAMGLMNAETDAAGQTVGFLSTAINVVATIVEVASLGIGTMIQYLEPLAPAIKWIAITVGIWKAAQWLLNIALNANPIGIVIGAIAAMVGAIMWVSKHTTGWGRSFSAIMTIIKVSAKMSWTHMKYSFGLIWTDLKILGLRFKQFGQYIKGLFNNIGKSINLALSFDFAGAKKALTAPIITGAEGEIDALKKQQIETTKKYQLDKVNALAQIAIAKSQIGIKMVEKQKDLKKVAEDNIINTGGGKTEGSGGTGSTADAINSVKSTSSAIATGGKKQFTLNVQIDKVLETVNQTITNGQEGANELVDEILDNLTRRLHGTFQSVGQ